MPPLFMYRAQLAHENSGENYEFMKNFAFTGISLPDSLQ